MEREALSSQTDAELIRSHFSGNVGALTILIDRHTKSIYQFLYTYLPDRAEVEDLVQETWVKAWKHLRRFDQKRSFKVWIFTIAKRTALDRIKKKKPALFSQLETEDDDTPFESTLADDSQILPDELAMRAEEAGIIDGALKELKDVYREVLVLYYRESCSFEEISEILGRPSNTIRSQHRRGLRQLREILQDHLRAPN